MTRNGRHDGQPQQRLPPGIVLPQQVGVQQQIIKTDLADSLVYGFVANGQPLLMLYAGMSKLERAALMMAAGMDPHSCVDFTKTPEEREAMADKARDRMARESVARARAVLAECAKPEEPQPTTEGATT